MSKGSASLYDFVQKNPKAIEILSDLGFAQVKDKKKFRLLGKTITLKQALQMKNISLETFMERLEDTKDLTSNSKLRIQGLLPCPVRIPLLEGLTKLVDKITSDQLAIDYELKAASMGLDWLKDDLLKKDFDQLPDLFLSAGFDIFFERQLFGHYREEGLFADISGWPAYNQDFLDLKDPKGQYAIIGVVPAIFLINEEELNGRTPPESWEELLSPEFARSVSLPIGDFDLFNAILLNIYKRYGDSGLDKLGRSLLVSMHPAQMVHSHRQKEEKPLVTIMPYFFSKMVFPGSPMKAVWPKDGAIISPIFALAKKDKKELLQPLMDYFSSMEVAEILSHRGKFPSTHPHIDNQIESDKTYQWLGWDYIEGHDIGEILRHCEARFHAQGGGDL